MEFICGFHGLRRAASLLVHRDASDELIVLCKRESA